MNPKSWLVRKMPVTREKKLSAGTRRLFHWEVISWDPTSGSLRSYQLGPDVSSKDDSWSRYGPRCQSLTWSRRRKRPWQRRSPKKKRLTKKRKWRFRRENVPETGMRFQELKNRSSWYQHWESKKLSLVNSSLQRRPRDGLNQMPLPGKEFGSTGNEF